MGYSTDVTDAQWAAIEVLFSGENRGKHLQTRSKRDLINGVLYINKVGCQWRMLPKDFPPYATVWSFYRRAVKSGLWEEIMARLVEKPCTSAGRVAAPAYLLIDS